MKRIDNADTATAVRHGWLRRAYRRARTLRKREDGATAIEFAIVGTLFFTLVFGIIELALVFFTSSVLSHAVADAGRKIRVGQFQGCNGEADFKQLVCDNMDNLMGCTSNLRVDVIRGPSFADIVIPDPGDGGLEKSKKSGGPGSEPKVAPGTYDSNSAGDPVAVRATFYYPLALPPQLTRLESRNASGAVISPGRHVIRSTTAFRNEPFPSSSTCAVDKKKSGGGSSK